MEKESKIKETSFKKKYSLNIKDLEKETDVFRSLSSGPGGQRRDKKKTKIMLHHLPSGISVSIDRFRFQKRNEELAFEILKEKLGKLNEPKEKRIPTRIPFREKMKRLEDKKKKSEKKKGRKSLLP